MINYDLLTPLKAQQKHWTKEKKWCNTTGVFDFLCIIELTLLVQRDRSSLQVPCIAIHYLIIFIYLFLLAACYLWISLVKCREIFHVLYGPNDS